MRQTISPLLTLLILITLLTPEVPAYEKGQMVTWSNFNFVRSVACSMSSTYFATTNGVIHYDKSLDVWKDPLTGSEGIDHQDIQEIWTSLFDEHVYARTSDELFEYDPFFEQWYSIDQLPTLNNDSKHISSLPLLYPPFGYNYDAEGRLIDPNGQFYSFTDVVDDGSGRLWIGTWGYGGAVAGTGANVIELLPFGLLQERVNAIIPVENKLLIGGELFSDARTGLTLFDPDSLTFSHIESGLDNTFPATDINCLTASEDYYYLGTSYGLMVMNRDNRQVERRYSSLSGLSDNNILSLATDHGLLFIGTERGLDILVPDAESLLVVRPGQLNNLPVYDLEIVDTTVWLATDDGAFRYFPSTGKLQRAADRERLLSTQVRLIQYFGDDLWFATRDGLVRLNVKTGSIDNFLVASYGLDEIQALAVNEVVVMAGTWRGLTMIYYTDPHHSSRRFTTSDGLPTDDINSLLMDGDFVWIGTDRGLTRFWWNNPDRVD
ncbi:MAG TPA: hypothetical protein PLF13_10800 [candidate division Zixibacteria bacterium]|mgnify:CR=1 FL=1|nr:hypothetical protein [candidate division Zixibacteria bacterium]